MNQQALEAVIQKEATFLHQLADECERSGLEYGKGRANGIRETIASIRAALTAYAEACGERVVWTNTCKDDERAEVDGGMVSYIKPGEELVIRKAGT